ncbi:glutamate receptor ionotropic, delta-1-like [Eriocheir sinensis]|uniref:glutamate receptor ionotropic, delta-1-like n=1 Tax=Eriocheir sinensis TaxID=95602 RepID=UPI0021CA3824|nr:glutamate receptor ionotropic, delta-1-like [Eriocheir sinensis]
MAGLGAGGVRVQRQRSRMRASTLLLLPMMLARDCTGAPRAGTGPPTPPSPPSTLPTTLRRIVRGPPRGTGMAEGNIPSLFSLASQQEGTEDLKQLMAFLLNLTAEGQLYLVHDDDNSEELAAAERAWRRGGRTLTLLPYEPEARLLTAVLKNDPRHHVLPMRNVLVLCSPQHVAALFRQVRKNVLESRSTQWIVVTTADLTQTLPKELREGTQVALVQRERTRAAQLYSSSVQADGEIRFSFVGEWSAGSGAAGAARLRGRLLPDVPELYSDLQGRHLVVTTNNNWPFFKIITLDNGTVIPVSGVDLKVITTLSEALNFTYHLIRPPDGKWGGPQPDGTVTGLIGQVARHEAHATLCELSVTSSRETVVDFTFPYFLESTTLVSGAPKEKSRTFAVFSPFTLEVWLCIVVVVAAMGPFLYLLTRPLVLVLDHSDQPQYTPQELGFNMYRNFMVQSNLIRTSSWVLKIMFFSWYLFSFYINALYSGTLTAVLAIPAFEKPIDSLEQLASAHQRGYTIGTTRDSSFEDTLKSAVSGIYREVWLLMNHEDPSQSFLATPGHGIQMILKRKYFVFINAQLNSIMKATQLGRHQFHIGRQTFLPQSYGIACNTGSPLRDAFSSVLLRLIEGGLVYKWAGDEVSGGASSQSAAKTSGPPSITLQHLQAAFFLLTLGLSASVVALGGEVAARRWWRPGEGQTPGTTAQRMLRESGALRLR